MNSLSVIIPSRDASNLIPCVEAVRKHEPDVDIIIIDDGIEVAALPRSWFDFSFPIEIFRGDKPFVYARNCNEGMTWCDPADVVLLNDDALLETPGGFRALQQQHYAHPEYGIVGSSINWCGTPNQHRKSADRLRLEKVMLVFACVFIPRSTIQRVGLLDERFCVGADGNGPRGYGCEDDDYSWRVRQSGLKLAVYDGCYVNHTKLKSTFRGDPEHPVDVKIHEALFEKKWGMHPRHPEKWQARACEW